MISETPAPAPGPLANKSYAVIGDGLLAEYDRRAAEEADFWEDHWSMHGLERSLRQASEGKIQGMEFLLAHLPRRGRILEAGCGIGQLVAALAARGYEIEGIDFAQQTLQAARKVLPELPARHGDLRCLKVPDRAYACYLSFGVIEHFEQAASLAPLMHEARRVTDDLLFFSVPYFSPALQLRIEGNELPSRSTNSAFYQYYFTRSAFERLLRQYGLEPFAIDHYATLVGLQRHHPLIRRLYPRIHPLQSVMRRTRGLIDRRFGARYGHMIGAWCRKS